ncbi:beta-xylosidase [Sphingomonas sp. BK235]|uniref:GH39 family glycosyl hydrolase n=1 Tax=Sphingomonas sp. BK235 TaxID=2512131 RepID=UPI0010D39363|nr:beta-xylosidase [Sphingomonas sp. BK235]TCP37542.1 xylan 1,4-beta-xylosidase [Sphingomonas sp. BK235]
MHRMMVALAALLLPGAAVADPVASADTFAVTIDVATGSDAGAVEPVWRFFGADEPNYATMKDGRTTLATLGALAPGRVYFRAHNLLTSGDGTPALKWGSTGVYREDARGRAIYDWTIVDRIFDTYRARGVKPYVELGFMPEALSTRPHPYQHDWRPGSGTLRTGWAYPPRDYARWEELIHRWVRHCVERYGRAEVASWYFETWNEANLSQYYWAGTREEFFRLHDAAVRGVKRALPEARVGGPDNAGAGDDFLAAFLAHVRAAGTPTDFLSFHAKGQPEVVKHAGGEHVRMGLRTHLRAADHEFTTIAADPVYRDRPIVIGESDPEGCAACQGPANAYRNGTMYASYTAASFPRLIELARRRALRLEGILTWAFEFEDQPPFAGFRQLTSGGIDLPVMNVFKLFAKMTGRNLRSVSDRQLPLDTILRDGVRGAADVGSVASRDGDTVSVLVWHYHDDDVAGASAAVRLRLTDLPPAFAAGAKVTEYRVDARHANSFAAWRAMGSPIAPTDAQRAALLRAAALVPSTPAPAAVTEGRAVLDLTLPRQGVSLLVVSPARR